MGDPDPGHLHMKNSLTNIRDRREKILDYLKEHSSATIHSLADELGTSEITIRRDLAVLEEKGLVRRSYGEASLVKAGETAPGFTDSKLSSENVPTGVSSIPPAGFATPFILSQSYVIDLAREHSQRLLAEYAASYVTDGDIIFLNSSHTVSYIVEYLSNKAVTVVTNNLFVLERSLSPHLSLVFTGGQYHVGQSSLTGGVTTNEIGNLIANKCFLGVSGIGSKSGITSPYLEESYANAAMIRHTDGPVVVLTEGFKIGRNDRFQVSGFDRVDHLITDSSASRDELDALKACGMKIDIVDNKESG